MTFEPEEVKRFRSFAERYVIERAAQFRADHELEDAWECVSAAKTVYKMAARQANEFNPEANDVPQTQGAQRSPPPSNPVPMTLQQMQAQAHVLRNPVTGKPGQQVRVKLPEDAKHWIEYPLPDAPKTSARTRWLQLKQWYKKQTESDI